MIIARLNDACPAFADALCAYDLASVAGDEDAMAQAWADATIAASAFRQGIASACRVNECNALGLIVEDPAFNTLLETLRGATLEMATALGAERSDNSETAERAAHAASEP